MLYRAELIRVAIFSSISQKSRLASGFALYHLGELPHTHTGMSK